MIHVQGLRRNVKNVVKNYSDAQVKVREGTSNDPWGPSGTLMSEIADLTYNVVAFSEIMQVIWKRLNDHGKNWRHVYKALVLLEYLIKTGSEKVTQQCRENLFAIQTLRDFQYFEEGKDQGVNVREKAKQLVALLKDDERLRNERSRALKARERLARANANAYAKQQDTSATTVPKTYGSSEFSQGSFDEEMMSPGALSLSELENARPQTAGEEELQLQLALAMSKEEADQAERLKRNDDLRLQMALSESEEEFKKNRSSSVDKSSEDTMKNASSAIEDLLGLNLNENSASSGQAAAAVVDPWGLPLTSSSDSNVADVWNTNTDVPESNRNILKNDPWSPALDNSNRGLQNSSMFASSQDNISDSSNSAFDMSGMKKSLSADVGSMHHQQHAPSSLLDAYLGTESTLITLDQNLSRARALPGNPFQAAKPPPMTINEMRVQNQPENGTLFLPTSTSMPFGTSLTNNSPWTPKQSQNPFM